MAKYLYEVAFNEGRSNPEHGIFMLNVMNLNAKVPDYGGINNLCIISHHMDRRTIFALCADGLTSGRNDLTVTEITKKTLASSNSTHRLFSNLIEKYYLPYGDYPNIK